MTDDADIGLIAGQLADLTHVVEEKRSSCRAACPGQLGPGEVVPVGGPPPL